MRSLRVVLPESMWAEMPRLRMKERGEDIGRRLYLLVTEVSGFKRQGDHSDRDASCEVLANRASITTPAAATRMRFRSQSAQKGFDSVTRGRASQESVAMSDLESVLGVT